MACYHQVCVFAYGQTGSGKTFTMLGSEEAPGMIPRAMTQIFETSKKLQAQVCVGGGLGGP